MSKAPFEEENAEANGDHSAIDNTQNLALLDAVRRGDFDEVKKRLLEDKDPQALVNISDNKKWTPLHWACCNGQVRIVELLLQARADVHARTSVGDTPLHWAAYAGQEEICWLLQANGAELNATGNCANTPLHLACSGNHEKVAHLLLEAGASVTMKNSFGNTPAMLTTSNAIATMLKTAGSEKQCYKCEKAFTNQIYRHQCKFCMHQFCERCVSKEMLAEKEKRWSVWACGPCHLTMRADGIREREERLIREELERRRLADEEAARKEQEERLRKEQEEWEGELKAKEEEERRIKEEEERKRKEEEEKARLAEEERLRLEAEAAKKKKKKKGKGKGKGKGKTK